jgi:hypothetical protein
MYLQLHLLHLYRTETHEGHKNCHQLRYKIHHHHTHLFRPQYSILIQLFTNFHCCPVLEQAIHKTLTRRIYPRTRRTLVCRSKLRMGRKNLPPLICKIRHHHIFLTSFQFHS